MVYEKCIKPDLKTSEPFLFKYTTEREPVSELAEAGLGGVGGLSGTKERICCVEGGTF